MKQIKKIYIIFLIAFLGMISFYGKSISIFAFEDLNGEKTLCNATMEDDFDSETILVTLSKKMSLNTKEYTNKDFSEIECLEVREITENLTKKLQNQLNGVVEENELMINPETYNRILEIKIANKGKSNVLTAIKALEKREDVKCVEPNYLVTLNTNLIGNDQIFENNVDAWWIDFLNLPQAWDITTGSKNINVGIIDTGIESHDDLNANLNYALSKDFSPNQTGAFCDEAGHGTMVAGIIGASGNNEIGVAGVCWNVGLVSLKVMNASQQQITTQLYDAITYAAEKNIPILNISLGSEGEIAHCKEAIENYNGLVVCAAGNDNKDIDESPRYPASYDSSNIITVGACDENGEQWINNANEGSNYGKTVDIFAPGKGIISTYGEAQYFAGYGTSLAAPFVSGVAALILSKYPNISVSTLKDAIIFHSAYSPDLEEISFGILLNAASVFDFHGSTHKYTASYDYYTNTYHKAYCECGEYQLVEHSHNEGSITQHTSTTCLKCHANFSLHYYTYKYYSVSGHIESCDCGETRGSVREHVSNSSGHSDYCVVCKAHTSIHDYKNRFTYYNSTRHKAFCECGEYILRPHAVTKTWTSNGHTYGTCIECKQTIDLGSTIVIGPTPMTVNTKYSIIYLPEPDKSYIRKDGIIILREEDVEDYLNGNLTFD